MSQYFWCEHQGKGNRYTGSKSNFMLLSSNMHLQTYIKRRIKLIVDFYSTRSFIPLNNKDKGALQKFATLQTRLVINNLIEVITSGSPKMASE